MENNETKQPSFDGANLASQIIFGKPIAAQAPAPEATPEEKKPEVIETPLMKIPVKTDDLFAKINQETGYDFKSEEDFVNALKRAKEFETKEEEYLKSKKLGDDYIAFFNTLPEDLKRALVDYGAGSDYKATIKQIYGGELDYNKGWGDYDNRENLVKKYAELSSEEWEEMDDSARKVAERSAKKAYEAERQSFLTENRQRAENFEKTRREYTEKVIKSVDASIDRLRKDLPDMEARKVAEVRNKMLSNPLKDLLTEDGAYKEDAATKIAFAYHGQETMQQVIQRMNADANAAVQKAAKEASQGPLEDHVRRMNDKVPSGEDRQDKNPIEDAVRTAVKSIAFDSSSGFRNRQQP